MNKTQGLLFALLSSVVTCAEAGDVWTLYVTPQELYGNYVDSPVRENTTVDGVVFNLQYLERYAFLYGYNPLELHYKNNIRMLQQTTNYYSFRDFLTPDTLHGILTLRLDGYDVNNNDPTHETDDVRVISPIVSYINYDKTFYVDFGYAGSWYGESRIQNDGLYVSQYTPSVGFSFFNSLNWIRFRLYDIHTTDAVRSQDVTHTDALEITLMHYLIYYPFYVPYRIDLDFLFGKRVYAVDSDALVVYNLGDVQKNGVSVGAVWKLTSNVDFSLNGGHFNFSTLINNDRVPYTLNYIYGGITLKF